MIPWRQLLGIAFLAALVVGPLPLGLIVAGQTNSSSRHSWMVHGLLAQLIVWSSLQVSIALGLGALGQLRPSMVLTAEAVLFFGGMACVRKSGWQDWSDLRGKLAAPRTGPSWSLILLATLASFALLLLLASCMTPIKDYDSLAFHLPIIARWNQAHCFSPFDWQPQKTYPFDWEALSTLFAMPFHEDFLVDLPNWVAWNILGLAIYLTAREFGASATAGLTGLLLVLTLPLVRDQVTTMHVDLPLAAYFTAAVYFARARGHSKEAADTLLFLLAVGLMTGIKTTGLIYAPLALLILLFSVAEPGKPLLSTVVREFRGLLSIPLAPLWAMTILLPAGFWYLKNLFEVGNPLGSVEISLGSLTIFPGPISRFLLRETTLLHLFDPFSASDRHVLWSAMASKLGFGSGLVALSAALAFVRPSGWRDEREIRSIVLLGSLALVTALLYWTTPFSGSIERRPR